MSDAQVGKGPRRRGRAWNRKDAPRKPCGRLREPTLEQIKQADAEARRAAEEAEMKVVLAQPHRRNRPNARDQRLASALGRFCIANVLPPEEYTAGTRYAELLFGFYRAKGIPCPVRLNVGSGAGPADETVEKWERRIDRIELAIGVRDPHALQPMLNMLVFDEDQPSVHWPRLRMALEVLAEEMGLVQA